MMKSEAGNVQRPDEPQPNAPPRHDWTSDDWTNEARQCPACGSLARRVESRFCSTCGRTLEGGYFPSESLRASYHQLQRMQTAAKPRLQESTRRVQRRSLAVAPTMTRIFPAQNRNGASTTALAFVTYSLVPYLGILFCPGALLMGSLGLVQSYRTPQRGGRRASYLGIILGLFILVVQIFLWWLLYKVPEWTR